MNLIKTNRSIVTTNGLRAIALEGNSARLLYEGGDTMLIFDAELLNQAGVVLSGISESSSMTTARKPSNEGA